MSARRTVPGTARRTAQGVGAAIAVLVMGGLVLPQSATAQPIFPGNQGIHSPDQGVSSTGERRPAPPTATETYENPLDLELPNGGEAASCADPTVIRGQQPGDTDWYLYCTTDAIDEQERDAAGELVFHSIPMYRSSDLVNWTYEGDAFPTKPAWVPPTGGIWAPEITYRDGTYYLYFGAPETLVGGGSSAIGVATSDSPLGPWVDSGGPVVAPAESGRWQFDPEVITADGTTYLYFGSYFGGIFARQLTPDGLASLPETETPIAIDNRYEGAVVTERDGWYYLLASATDCCRGALTGYAVFAARSQSPLGPFVDRTGRSVLDSQVGGTPVLAQNGNRWVGVGHNDVFTDAAGRYWTIYHAVDQGDPYYDGEIGYTKRPALLDPLDWRDGWPVARGGAGPSDEPMPVPAAQDGERTAYRADFVRDLRVGNRLARFSDEFGGRRLDREWSWTREPDTAYRLERGAFRWGTQASDIHPPAEPVASVLARPAPRGDYVVETRVKVSVPAEGCCQNYVQGGLVIYGGDGDYVKLSSASIWNTRQTEFGKQISTVPDGYPEYGNTVVGPVGEEWTWLRIEVREGGATDRYTAYSSIDGRHWERGGTWTHELGDAPRIGLVSLGGAGFESTFDYVRVNALRR